MFKIDSCVNQLTDIISEGLIFIDNSGNIQIYNNKAKEIFGIINKFDYSHDAGKIEKGDIVIIGDNCIGMDDGGLTPEKLEIIGIYDSSLEARDAIIAIGIFKNEKFETPKYIINKYNNHTEKLELDCEYSSVKINVCIDFIRRCVNITINQDLYTMDYIKSIGHMVVLDSKEKKMKFYQAKGYTAKSEGICNLLDGKKFRAKGSELEFIHVIGKHIFEIHKDEDTIKDFYYVAKGLDKSYVNEYREIHGKPSICSLYPINQGRKRIGAVLKIEDMSEFNKIIKERDDALRHLYEIESKLVEEEAIKKLLPSFVGESNEILHVKKLALKASKTNSTVLILGESGTGKSILAKEIHDNSKSKEKPFIHVNCASIPETLLESELFGYEEGAFTGAKSGGKAGLFELAQGGTLFLDEIGEISIFLQSKLLQVLQDKTYFKLGGKHLITLNARIILATNKNLEDEIQKGRFREDLYYRINVFPILIPPLRSRKQDIAPLIKSLLPKICKRIGCEEKGISVEAMNLLASYDFPGNVRELENILERSINILEGNIIFSKHISILGKEDNNDNIKPLKNLLSEAEKLAIENAIKLFKGDKNSAMKALKIGKTNFYDKLKKYNIKI